MSTDLPHAATGPSRRTMAFLSSVDPDVRVLDGGPGKVKEIDREWYDAYAKEHGGRALRAMGLDAMEADWVACSVGLLYANPKLGYVRVWPWERTSLHVAKRGRRFCRLWVADDETGERHLLRLGAAAMENLIAAAARSKELSRRSQHASSKPPRQREEDARSGGRRKAEHRTSEVLKKAAVEDAVATQLAQAAMQSWHQDFGDLIRHAAQSGAPLPVNIVFAEAYATVRATKQAVAVGEVPGNTEGIYNELRIVGQSEAAGGTSKEWVVARWMLRQAAVLLALRMYLGETPDLDRALAEWEAARDKLERS